LTGVRDAAYIPWRMGGVCFIGIFVRMAVALMAIVLLVIFIGKKRRH